MTSSPEHMPIFDTVQNNPQYTTVPRKIGNEILDLPVYDSSSKNSAFKDNQSTDDPYGVIYGD